MNLKKFKSTLLKKWGYRKVESRHKFIDPFQAQAGLISNKNEPLIFDVGANIGQTAREYRSAFPNASIYCFEPVEKAYRALQSNIEKDQKIKTFPLAFSNKATEQSFFVNKRSDTSSLLQNAEEGPKWAPQGCMERDQEIKIVTHTIDQFCSKEKIGNIDILKLDTQGAELLILQGAENMLRNRSISLIYAEVLFVPLYKGQCFMHEVSQFLSQYGYSLFDLFQIRYSETGQIKWADALFLRIN